MNAVRPARAEPSDVDLAGLERQLRADVRGGVRFDRGTRALYTADASNYRRVPLGVVTPATVEDVVATVAACREHGVALTPRGGGTSIVGNAIGGGLVLDTSRHLTRVLDLDSATGRAVVEPGVVLDTLQAAAAPHGLTFGPDPSTHRRCTLGGMIGNNACGSHSVAWGKTSDNVEALDVLLHDGTRMTVGATPRDELDRLAAGPGRTGEVYRALRGLVDGNLAPIRTRLGYPMRQVCGYPLDALLPERGHHVARALVGTEGTCVTVLGATVRLVRAPAARTLLVLGYPDDGTAADAVPQILTHAPIAVEGIDDQLVEALLAKGRRSAALDALPVGHAWLFVEFGGPTPGAAEEAARRLAAELDAADQRPRSSLVTDPRAQRALWRIREEGAGIATRMADGAEAWPGWEDAAVPPARLGAYLREFRELKARHGLSGVTYGHYGDGCIHVRLTFDLVSEAGVGRFRRFVEEAADLVVAHGGSYSGEHGDGQARAELLPRLFGDEMVGLFGRFKAIWDPDDRMNPGILVRPYRMDDNLRLGAGYQPRELLTVFSYPDDPGGLAGATRRCIGVGKCRDTTGAVMCPSYQATREERHSTRGRARLLFEMLRGDSVADPGGADVGGRVGGVVTGGWRSAEVRDALDLCLACKACRSDCPVNVDMATYKAEFLHHHYRRRLRPASHYSMGFLPLWARAAALAPRVVNAVGRAGWAAAVLKRVGGVTPERELPSFADESFVRWFRRRARAGGDDGVAGPDPVGRGPVGREPVGREPAGWGPMDAAGHRAEVAGPGPADAGGDRPTVVLWPDTFTNYLSPGVGQAAVAVLESAGFRVVLPPGQVCCGLTWISTGQLGTARRVARRSLRHLGPHLEAGTPVVGLEPSCTAALRSDLPELLADPSARRLADQTFTLAEFLAAHAPGWEPPRHQGTAIVQTHCHQHAVLSTAADEALLARTGLVRQPVEAGCCGLAGNFGFERGHYEVAQAVGERAILPAVRAAAPDTVVLADGFSCRTQIAHSTDRRAVHLAELLAGAAPDRPAGPRGQGGR